VVWPSTSRFDPQLGYPVDVVISTMEGTREISVTNLVTDGTQPSPPVAPLITVPLSERAAVTEADAQEGARVVNAFGADLYRQVVGSEAGNVVLSPWSIATALGMVRAGARGTTAAELDQVLHASTEADLHRGLNALEQVVVKANGPYDNGGHLVRQVVVAPANSVWAQQGYPINDAFQATLRSEYGGALQTVDYVAHTEAARKQINGWVGDRTAGKIPDLIGPGQLTGETRLTLVNAVRVAAPWQVRFDDAQAGQFTRLDGSTVTVPSMAGGGLWQYAAGEGWQAVDVPYGAGDLAMTVIVPDAGRFADVERSVTGEWLAALDAAQGERTVALRLPRWDDDLHLALREPLQALGVRTGFTLQADFSGISSEPGLLMSAVIHAATITVDEEGTEATAASAVVMCGGSAAPTDVVDLNVDRPYLYAIRHVATGAVLFLGRVVDPTT
jgi:serine protease inhibitor